MLGIPKSLNHYGGNDLLQNNTELKFPHGPVKDSELSLLWHRLDPCSGRFHMSQVWPKNKKKKNNNTGVPAVA